MSLHSLSISSPFTHSLSIFSQPGCQAATSCATLHKRIIKFVSAPDRIELVSWRQPVLSFPLPLSPSSALSVALSFALSLSPPFALSLQTKFVSSFSSISCYLKCTRWSSPQLWWRKLLDGIHFISLSWRWINWSKELQLEIISLLLGWLGLG